MEKGMLISVLYVDDERQNLIAFRANFKRLFNVFLAESASEALSVIENNKIDVVITDHMMPEVSGADLLETLKNEHPAIGRILITGVSDINVIIDAINTCEVYRFLTKPWVKDDLTQTIEAAYYSNQQKQQELQLNEKLVETNQQLEFMLRQKLIS